ncbi:MAG: O-antigen ligase family protein [Anaerolineales bacterium]|nr:O-antigen ligase family protein [Anaerolineales bacterium]
MTRLDWPFLWRQTFLLLAAVLGLVVCGGFAGLIDFRLQAVTTGLAALVLGGWLLWRALRRQRLATSGIEAAWLIFLAVQVLAAVVSEDIRRSLPHTVTWFAYFAVFLFVLDLLRRGWPAQYLETALFAAAGLVLFSAWAEWFGYWQGWRGLAELEFLPGFVQRTSSLLGDPNLLAAFINLILPLLAARWLLAGRWPRAALTVFILAALGVLYFADSRGGLLGFGASAAVLAALWLLRVSPRARDAALRLWAALWGRKVLLAGLALVAVLGAGFFAWRMLSFQGDTTHGPVLTSRDVYWDAARLALATDPLAGAGQGMYPVYLMQVWSMPPARPYLHAHSLYFQTLAESGWLGLLALGWLGFSVVRRAWGAWQGHDVAGRARWAAALAALAGLAVHSLVDDFFPLPAAGVTVMALIAFALAPGERAERGSSLHPAWLLLPGAVALAFSLYALRSHSLADRAWQGAATGDWPAAAAQMLGAAEADPGFAAYWLHAGYAQAQAGDLDGAADSYRRGIALEPVHGLNHANLAAVYWAGGEPGQALTQMRIATRQSPEAWQFWLNQAVYEEVLGEEGALASYQTALHFNPALAESIFWQAGPLRQQALVGFVPPDPAETARAEAQAAVAEGRQALAAGDLAAAGDALARAHTINDQEVLVYVGLAELAMAQGDLELAERYVAAALWLQTTRNQSKVEATLVGAEVAALRGDQATALRRYEAAFAAISAYDTYGWGSANWSPYFWFVFQRRAFAHELLPWLERADISAAVAQRLLPLAELYEEDGLMGEADAVREALAEFLP